MRALNRFPNTSPLGQGIKIKCKIVLGNKELLVHTQVFPRVSGDVPSLYPLICVGISVDINNFKN